MAGPRRPDVRAPASTGALAFPAPGLGPSAAGAQTDSALHDTYYVVAHGSYIGGTAVAAVAILLAWWAIRKLHPGVSRWLAIAVLALFVAGVALGTLPMLLIDSQFRSLTGGATDLQALAGTLGRANAMSQIGAHAAAIAVAATVIAFLWSLAKFLRGRA